MKFTKRAVVAAVTTLAMLVVGGQAGFADGLDPAERLITAKTGSLGEVVPPGGSSRGGIPIKPARGLRTWLQLDSSRIRLVAELDEGQSKGTFEDVIPEGWHFEAQADGSLAIHDQDGRVQGHVEPPWALDSDHRALKTQYTPAGNDLEQTVDTRHAAYPIVMDPTVTTGWWFTTPVYYLKYDWSGTWKLKNYIDDNRTLAAALICNFVPTTVGRTTCQAIFILVRADIIDTVNRAIAAGKCYKVRLPALGGAIALPAYDSYYVTC